MGKSSRKEKKTSAAARSLQSTAAPVYGTPRFQYFVAGFVSLLTFLVYLSCLHNKFVLWDDNRYIYENPHIHPLNAAFFRWAFSGFYCANWHPLTWISHAMDYAVWGLNPLGHHLTNNILHAVNTFIVVVLVAKLLETQTLHPSLSLFWGKRATLIAAGVTGLLFGIHPLHVESVAWVSERKDLLCAMFFLLSIMAYIKYASVNALPRLTLNKHYMFVLGFFTLALLSKPMAVSLPVILLILDWYPFERIRSLKSFRNAAVEKLPMIILSLISSILTVLAQKAGGAIQSVEAIPLSSRVLVAAESLLAYLWKMALPVNLIPYYSYPKNMSLFSFLPVILVPAMTAACIIMARRQKLLLSVWGYYVFTLFPVIGIVQVGGQAMADRYTYLPSLGPFLMIGLLAAWGLEKVNTLQKQALTMKIFGITAAILVLFSLASLTFRQAAIWKDSLTLWTYVIGKEPENPLAHNNLGVTYKSLDMPDKAMEQYLAAIKLKPDYAQAHANLGVIYQDRNMPDKAMEQYLTAIKLQPDYAEAHANLGVIYQDRSMPDKAMEEFLTALKLKPDDAEAHYNLGVFYKSLNMSDKAIEQYLTAIKLQPDYAKAHNNLGLVYKSLNMPDKAMEQYALAVKLKPEDAEAHDNLGVAYQTRNMPDKAMEEFLTALKLKPDYAEAHYNLGVFYKSLNMPDKAMEQYLMAIKLKPDFAAAHNNLGGIYLALNMPDKAEEEFLTAIRLKPDFAEPHFYLGMACYNKGQMEKAQRELARGLEIKPDNQQARELLKTIGRRASGVEH